MTGMLRSLGRCGRLGQAQVTGERIAGLAVAPYAVSAPSHAATPDTHRQLGRQWQQERSHTYVPLNPLQRAAIAVFSAIEAARDPKRADLVAALGETTGEPAFRAIRDRMRRCESGRELLRLRPRMRDESLAHLRDLPPNTLGGAYSHFMDKRHFHADDRPPVRFITDEEVAYAAARSREVHDLWHVLFACHTNVFGELALKALEYVQTGLPMAALSVVGAQWRLKPAERRLLWRHFMPWALRAGASCPDLLMLHYEAHFEEDLQELRQKWNIITAPPPPRGVVMP